MLPSPWRRAPRVPAPLAVRAPGAPGATGVLPGGRETSRRAARRAGPWCRRL